MVGSFRASIRTQAPLVEPTEGYMRKKTQSGGREMKQEMQGRWKEAGDVAQVTSTWHLQSIREGMWPPAQEFIIFLDFILIK